jgi:3-oxoacyl-[acyl-carrier protein] reductase
MALAAPARLDGKVAMITGGSEGIGREIASHFVDAGAAVCLVARRDDILADAVAALTAQGGRVIGVAGSVTDAATREESVTRCVEELDGLDVLVNNAGASLPRAPLVDTPEGVLDDLFVLNQKVPLLYAQLAWHAAMAERGGSIVNITSFAGLRPQKGYGFYGATKAALDFLTRSMALELAPKVRVNAIAPGSVATEMFIRNTTDEYRAKVAMRPLGRIGTPSDIAAAAVFLASDESSYMTGQTLAIEGGGLLG